MRKHLVITALCALAAIGAFVSLPSHPAAAAARTSCRATYIVRRGDTLSRIGSWYHVSYWAIANASGIRNPNLIYPGQRLCIPASGSVGSGGGQNTGGSQNTGGGSSASAPGGYQAWGPVPDFAGDPYSSSRGQCTWWAATRRLDENWWGLGTYAYQWAYNAPSHGFRTGYTPAVGATVVFQPGVDGASSYGGHVGHVEAVYGNGWFLISEMNFYAYGGGWDRVDYRTVHVGSGVSFIY